MMTMVKVNYIKDAHNNEKKYFDTDIPIKFENSIKKNKDMEKYVKHIKIAKNLIEGSRTAVVVFF